MGHDMLGMQSHVITDDHVGSALKLAMSSMVGPAADGSAATELHRDGDSGSSVAQNGSQHERLQLDAPSGGSQEEPQARRLGAQDVAGLAASALSSGAAAFAPHEPLRLLCLPRAHSRIPPAAPNFEPGLAQQMGACGCAHNRLRRHPVARAWRLTASHVSSLIRWRIKTS